MDTALLIIDLQNDYFPGGKLALESSPEASLKARQLLEAFRAATWPVVHIQHIAVRPGATFFLPGTEGAEIHANVRPLPTEAVFEKHYPNSFRETPLLEHLRALQAKRLVIAGMQTHMCAEAATRAACDFGFECWVAHDACATRALSFGGQTAPAAMVHLTVLAALNGTYAQVLSTDEILTRLRG